MMCSMKCMIIICLCLNCDVSGKFPETAWRAMHSR